MGKIKKIEIQGFLNQGDFKWELDPVVNILGGINGSGKTSILMFCHTLLFDNGRDNKFNKRLARVFNRGILTLDGGSELYWSKDSGFQDMKTGTQSFLFEQSVNTSEIDLLLGKQIDLYRKHPNDNKLFAALDRFFVNYEKPYNSDFIFSRNNQSVRWQQFSIGEKRLFLLLLTVYNMRSESSVLLLDSPELCMHIDWQEILIKELYKMNPNMQIIAVTHAPCIITGWMDRVNEVGLLITQKE